MVSIKSEREIALMKEAGHYNYLVHEEIKKHIKPGVTTNELDKVAVDFCKKNNVTLSCLGYEGFPKSICVSVNDEVVHGIPGNRRIQDGDIVSVDLCVGYKGYQSDAARTYIVGDVSDDIKDLVKYTEEALYVGLKEVKAGARIGDIGNAIENFAHSHNLGVVEELCGHGLGTDIHEDPDVPNFGEKGTGMKLKPGMTIAVEPMLTLGNHSIAMLDDDWTIVTRDGSYAAHFEHTVVVTEDGYEILTGE